MKKISAVVLFICFNALLIFFEVHKQSQYLQLSYDIQKLQTKLNQLIKHQSHLLYQLHKLQQPDTIQDIATSQLAMKPIEFKNIIKLSKENPKNQDLRISPSDMKVTT